ncbi:MAG: hypothetical protein QXU73_07605 [Thermoplasmata archaeon]
MEDASMTRFRCARTTAALGAVLCVVVLLLPVLVSAESQTVVTEYANFQPYADNNDEVVNIANETIRTNIDTWNPRPSGIFVGGTIEESLMTLKEVASGDDAQLALATVIRFQQEYAMSGVSSFIVRLPIYVDMNNMPQQVNFAIYRLDTPDYSVARDTVYSSWNTWVSSYDKNPFYPDSLNHTDCFKVPEGLMLYPVWNVAHLNPKPRPHTPPYAPLELWTNAAHSSYLINNRLYVQVTAPLLPDYYYVLLTQVYYNPGSLFQIYFCPSDLCSDNLTNSRIAYLYYPAPDQVVVRNWPVAADLGYSFVLQKGLSGLSYEYNAWFDADDILEWQMMVKVPNSSVSGALNFILEYRTNVSTNVTWRLSVMETTSWICGIDDTYWIHKTSNSGYILASNPVNRTYPATNINGEYYISFLCTLRVENPIRLQLMTVYDPLSPSAVNNLIHAGKSADGAYYYTNRLAFGMWCSISIQNVSLNETDVVNVGQRHPGFWEGIGRWWDKHWIDIVAAELIVIGAALSLTGVGAVFGVPLMVLGVGMILYNNWPTFRNFVNNFVKMIIDGLEWLGNWVYKVGMAIWKALTWLVDQVVYYGAILLGLLIIAVAVALFVGPIYAEIKILGAFLMMAQGDYDKAAAQLGGLISQGRELVRR